MAVNDNTFNLRAAAVVARDAEYPGTPLTDPTGDGTYDDPYLGCNRAGSCAPGIGIATANGQCKLEDWTVLDQHEAARNPQDSQHIGGTGLGAGSEGLTTVEPIRNVTGADINDTFSLNVEATGWVKNVV